MRLKSIMIGAALFALPLTSTVASAATRPAQSATVSVARAAPVQARLGRIGAHQSNLAGGGGFFVAIIAVVAVIVGVIIVSNNDDDSGSN